MSDAWLCVTCGTQYAASESAPAECPICLDPRQYVGWSGQQWTTLESLAKTHRNVISEEEPGVYSIHTKPDFGIGQRAFLLRTGKGNLLWDCVALLDDATRREVNALGGVDAIAISHPHYYTTMVDWSRAFGDPPVWLHESDEKWVMRPDGCVHFWTGETKQLLDGIQLIRTGGHFDGYQVAHWASGSDGQGTLFAGDQPEVCMDRNWVTFMYSYPNFIPLNARAVRAIGGALQPFPFSRLYAAFPGRELRSNAKEIVVRSAERYLRAISD